MLLRDLIARESGRQRRSVVRAMSLGAVVGLASVLLLGLSGWFLAAAALAGAAGSTAALAFNYMLPSAAIRLLAIARTGARYGEAVFAHDAALRIGARLRPALFGGVAAAPVQQALAVARGDALRSMIDDVARIETALVRRSARWNAIGAGIAGLTLAGLVGPSAILIVGAALLATLVASEALTRRGQRLDAVRDHALADLRLATDALLAAAPELRCYRRDHAAGLLDLPARALAIAERDIARVRAGSAFVQAGCMTLASVAVLALARHEPAPIAALATLAAAMTVDGIAPFLRALADRHLARDAADRLDRFLAHEPNRTLPVLVTRPCLDIAGEHLEPGDRMQLVGGSGAGKSTLIEHLLGLRTPSANKARLNGADIAFLTPEQRRGTFAWQPQDAIALSGTVRENLLIARPDACDHALWQALRDATLDEVIRALPDGLDSWIGEDGARLSGGERRRLAVARALLVAAPWLLLDEPVEGLDPVTARRLIERLARRLDRTGQGLIVVSHRPLVGLPKLRVATVACASLSEAGSWVTQATA